MLQTKNWTPPGRPPGRPPATGDPIICPVFDGRIKSKKEKKLDLDLLDLEKQQ